MSLLGWRRLSVFASALVLVSPLAGQVESPGLGGGACRVVAELEISARHGGLPDTLDEGDYFGSAVAALGDLDGDGVEDLAVGAPGYYHLGAVWILFLRTDGSVKAYREIGAGDAVFGGEAKVDDQLGASLAALGDLDGDGVTELAVGVPQDDDGGSAAGNADRGAVWVLFLRSDGTPKRAQKISALAGGFGGRLDAYDRFGEALAALGDLDGNGTTELAVGAPWDDDGGSGDNQRGAVWVLSLDSGGSVAGARKISAVQGGFAGALAQGNAFGSALCAPGDVDGDGTRELVVGAPGDADGSQQAGAAWVLFLRPDGTVRAQQKISATHGGFTGALSQGALFGGSIAAPGDLDRDGVVDIVVGAPHSSAQGSSAWVVFLNADGTVRAQRAITSTQLGIGVDETTLFGKGLAALGDLDGDGVVDLAAGEPYHSFSQGSVWTVFLAPDGGVRGTQAIDGEQPSFPSTLDDDDRFGGAVADLGDLDGDGVPELAVAASGDDEGGYSTGAVYVLFPNSDGTVRSLRKICNRRDGFVAVPGRADRLGAALQALGDLDGDGIGELAVGAPGVVGEDSHEGSVWVLFLRADGSVRAHQRIGAGAGGFTGEIEPYDAFGTSLAALGDVDGDGVPDLAVGAPGFYGDPGELWILHLAPDGSVESERELTPPDAGFAAPVLSLACTLAAIGDLDGDGVGELAVGSFGSDPDRGPKTLSILFLRADGSVRARRDSGALAGGFGGDLGVDDQFPTALAALGDLDGDGVEDLAAGTIVALPGPLPSWATPGAVWILFLRPDGTVKARQRIGAAQGGFGGALVPGDFFGTGLANLGDRDGDGLSELAVGALGSDDGGRDRGALWVLHLDGVVTLDFEHADDLARTPLVGGQALPGTAFTRTLSIASAGDNLGPTLFDSTPARGAGGSDPDLLVARGKLLVLQDPAQPAQSAPGIFAVPGDAPAGGVVTIDFRSAVEPRSLVLVDIDSEPGQGAEVTLVDELGCARVYDVPAGWTGDRRADRSAGFRTLDLTVLAPQPGFRSTARAHQHARFDARRVTTLRVRFARSGALDELRWDPYPALDDLGAPVRMR